jgi:hypothetical protein
MMNKSAFLQVEWSYKDEPGLNNEQKGNDTAEIE